MRDGEGWMIEDLRLADDEENQARIGVGSTLPRRIRSKNEGGCLIMECCFQAKLLLINCSDAFDVLQHRLVLGTLKLLLMRNVVFGHVLAVYY